MKTTIFSSLFINIFVILSQQASVLRSIYCPANAGNGTTYGECQSCDEVFALNTSANPFCQPYPPAMHVWEADQGSGLVMSYPSATQTPCSSLVTLKGWFNPTDTVGVQYPGITRNYMGLKILIGIVIKGTWVGPEIIKTNFINDGSIMNRGINTYDIPLSGQCTGDSSQRYFRIIWNYGYNTQNTLLQWKVYIDGTSGATLGQWAITQVLLMTKGCYQRCITCTTSTITCTACTTSGSWQSFLVSTNSTCVAGPDCPVSTYPDTATHICQPCSTTSCLTCNPGNICTACKPSFFLTSTALCVSTCPTGYFNDNTVTPAACTQCPNQCTACSSSTSCSACTTNGTYQSFLSGSSCVAAASCPAGKYPEITTHVCTACNSICLTCTGSATYCVTCSTGSGYFYANNTCYSPCPVGYYGNTGTENCQLCDPKCTACSTSATTCSACTTSGSSESFLTGSSCVASASCPAGTFPQTATHICKGCNTSCSTCSITINNCTACISTLFLLNNICYSTCPTGYYGNTGTGSCSTCDTKCTACSSLTSCSACTTSGVSQSFLTGTSCVAAASCPVGTYAQTATHVCTACNISCSTCLNTANNCTSCTASLFYMTNICYNPCPVGYYGNTVSKNCDMCDPKCTACTSLTSCSACTTSGVSQSFLTGSSCVAAASCPAGTYADTSTHVCTACNISCSTCLNTVNNCTACAASLYFLTNVCYSICPVGYYGSGTSCLTCNNKCTACSTTATTCSACTTSGVSQSFLSGTSCVASASCPAGTYPQTATHICTACNTSCSTCSLTANNCTACSNTPVILYYMSNICYSNCPNGYYQNTVTFLCTLCDAKCTLCQIAPTNCTACTTSGASQSFLNGFSCVAAASCPAGTYPETATHVCTACNITCATCQNLANNCTACVLGYFYLNNMCYTDCPLGYYQSAPAVKQCLACNNYCAACDVTSTNCTACVTSGANQAFLKVGNFCVVASSCPSGTYPQTLNHTCNTCNITCATCQNLANNCTSCVLGYFYLNNYCYTVCPINYYNSLPAVKQCLACNGRCISCSVSATNCSSCTTSGALQSYLNTSTNSCAVISSCAIGYYGNVVTHVCQICNTSCSTCIGTLNNCTWCVNPLFLLNNICYTVCPLAYYGNAGTCILCNALCQTCNGIQVNQCLSCKTVAPNQAFYLASNTTCYVTCPVGSFPVLATHICQVCNIACTQCTNSPSPCQACSTNYSYFNQTCLLNCPNGYYSAAALPLPYKVCKPCAQACLTCNGPTDGNCLTCNFDMYVYKSGSNCRSTCMPSWGYIFNSQYCTYCNTRCVSCYNSANNCTACKTSGTNQGFMIITDLVANTGNCYGTCPAGYWNNKTTHFCNNCSSPCANCSNSSTNCTSCITGYSLLNNNCYSPCPNGYFINGTVCSHCQTQCQLCTTAYDICTLCSTSLPTFLYNSSCLYNCPSGYYKSIATTPGNNTCQLCNSACLTCGGNPSPCYGCTPTYYFYTNTCNTSCYVDGYFADNVTWQCIKCDDYCVKLDLNMQFQSNLDQAILVTMSFSQDLDWSTFSMQDFQQFSLDNSKFTLDMFQFDYTILNSYSYQIRIYPKLYIFMHNLQITVTVMSQPDPNMNSSNGRPFHSSVYNQTADLIWSYMKAPDMSIQQKSTISQLINFTNQLQGFTNKTGIKEILQTGIFSWVFPGVQITSAIVLVNGIIPQHMYQGIRVMALMIFYQVPDWEKNADNARNIFNAKVADLVKNTLTSYLAIDSLQSQQSQQLSSQLRSSTNNTSTINPVLLPRKRALNTDMPQDWRFKRTGFSTFFIIDIYLQIILIVGSWLLLLLFVKCIFRKNPTHPHVRKMFLIFHKIHQISLMYVTIALVLEWLYFQKQQEGTYKWVSLAVCVMLLVYFLVYELYIYYDMFQYPQAHVNTRSYLIYATKYGHFLSKIRYQQYDINAEWSPRIWFRPYNYHILSFYKKFLMIFCLPIFHQLPYAQTCCLILLQILQIARCVITWPFSSKFRNIYRILLQLTLLLIFLIVLVCQYLSFLLMQNDPLVIQQQAKWFNLAGWVGLVLVIGFNLSIFGFAVWDMVTICKKGDAVVQMDQIRKQYYWDKVRKYQDQNQDIKVDIVSKWVKLGNLKEKDNVHQQAKFITVKVQKLKLEKTSDFFTVQITHASELRIRKQGFIYEQNSRRLTIKQKIRKHMEVTQTSNPQFYGIFIDLYKQFNIDAQFKLAKSNQVQPLFGEKRFKDTCQVFVETYLKIDLNQYSDGGRVYFYKNMIKHVINLVLNDNKIKKITVQEWIKGLPLSNKVLQKTQKKKKSKGASLNMQQQEQDKPMNKMQDSKLAD